MNALIDAAWDIYRQQLISGLTTLEFIRRLATAMDDLGSLDVKPA